MFKAIKRLFSGTDAHDCQDCLNEYDPYREDVKDDSPCVIGKTYYTHLRKWVFDNDKSEFKLLTCGGATLAFRVFKDDDDYTIEYTWARVNENPDPVTGKYDHFRKKKGRELCDLRLADKDPNNVMPVMESSSTHPCVRETKQFILDEYAINILKKKLPKHVVYDTLYAVKGE